MNKKLIVLPITLLILLVGLLAFNNLGNFKTQERNEAVTKSTIGNNKTQQVNVPANASASWNEHYKSLEAIVNRAELIVLGTVVDAIPEKRVDIIFTKQVVRIDKVVSGSGFNVGDTIQVLQTGGYMNGEISPAFYDDPLFSMGSQHLLFLKKAEDNTGVYTILGGFQGRADVVKDGYLKVNVENDPVGGKLAKRQLDSVYQEIDTLKNRKKIGD